MFHSIGMPLGLLIAMKPWKPTITNSMSPVTSGLMFAASTNGIVHSVSVPMRAIHDGAAAPRAGRPGRTTNRRFLSHFGKNGPLFIITWITDGKWWLTFEVAAQNQMKHQTSLQDEIHGPSFASATAMHASAT